MRLIPRSRDSVVARLPGSGDRCLAATGRTSVGRASGAFARWLSNPLERAAELWDRSCTQWLERQTQQVALMQTRVQALDPTAILGGYAYVTDETGQVVTAKARVALHWADGTIH